MDRTSIILMALAAVSVFLTLVPPRAPRARKSRAELRREWAEARPHWQGHEGWGGLE